MPCATAPLGEPDPTPVLCRIPGLEFDCDGRKSTLEELMAIGGFFPLSKVADRIPFPINTLRRWLNREDLGVCVSPRGSGNGGRPRGKMIDLNALEACLVARIQAGRMMEVAQEEAKLRTFRDLTIRSLVNS